MGTPPQVELVYVCNKLSHFCLRSFTTQILFFKLCRTRTQNEESPLAIPYITTVQALHSHCWLLGPWQTQIRDTYQKASLLSFWKLISIRAEPLQKEKKVDPNKDQAAMGHLKKRNR